MFEPVKNEKIYKMAVRQVISLIENGKLAPGEKLPPERELARILSVSRTSVRQAITVMEEMGFLETRHGEGTFVVTDREDQEIAQTFAQHLVNLQLTPLELLETRLVVECPVARCCAERASDDDIKQIESFLEHNRMERGEAVGLEKMNNDFHLAIARATGNRGLYSLVEGVYSMMSINLWPKLKDVVADKKDRSVLHLKQHVQIFEAIKARDPELTENLVRNHLKTIEHEFIEDATQYNG